MIDRLIKSKLHELTRRDFLRKSTQGLGTLALSSLLGLDTAFGQQSHLNNAQTNGVLDHLHHIPKAKRVIYLFQSGGPSQQELFDYKPKLAEMEGKNIPSSVIGGQRLTGMVTAQGNSLPLVGSRFGFNQYGQSGVYLSDLLPHMQSISDDICVVKSMHTDAINHQPAVTFFQTGSQQNGRPSIGSWLSYGLGSENANLPGFVVLLSEASIIAQNIDSNAWSNGFLPSHHQGVQFRSGKDPVLYLNNPDGIDNITRRSALDCLGELDQIQKDMWNDAQIDSKISQYEMAYKMQASVPETMDMSDEPDYIFEMYGEDARKPGTYAANCLLARRLAERDVRFIQLYHKGWDQHGNLPNDISIMAKSVDQASAALVKDLKQRGLLDDTLVVWGGEFGRTSFSQGKITKDSYGRDHHPGCFTMWMAGAGVKPGITYGETDEFGYNITKDPVHVHDFQATLLHLFGIDHKQLTYKYQGRRFRLTDVHGKVVKDILS